MSEFIPIINWTMGRMPAWRSDFVFPDNGEYTPLHEVGDRKNDHHSYVTVKLDDEKAEAIENDFRMYPNTRDGIESMLKILGIDFETRHLARDRFDDYDVNPEEIHIRNLTAIEEQSRYSYAYIVNLWEGPGTYFIYVNHEGDIIDIKNAERVEYECETVDDWRRAVERWFGGIVIAGKADEDAQITKDSEH